jgi:hypothetical protein
MRHAKSLAVFAALLLGGCATWTTAETKPSETTTAAAPASTPAPAPANTARPAKAPAEILVTEADITDRPYTVIGDITVSVNKTTIFHPDPTQEMVKEALQKEAAGQGADAVILARYGTVGIAFFSWGSIEGKGRAIRFK